MFSTRPGSLPDFDPSASASAVAVKIPSADKLCPTTSVSDLFLIGAGHSKCTTLTGLDSQSLQAELTRQQLDSSQADRRPILSPSSHLAHNSIRMNDSWGSGDGKSASFATIRPSPIHHPPVTSPDLLSQHVFPSLPDSPPPPISPILLVSPPSISYSPVVLDSLLKEKMNYRCTYDPALDTSVVKKSSGPLYRHFKPSGTIISNPGKDPRLKLAYPSPLLNPPQTPSQKSALVAGLSRCSRGRQTFHSQVETFEPYSYDKNSVGPPPPPPPTAVLVTALDKLVTGEQVRSHFAKFGRVAECELKLDPQTGGSLGICWLRFVNDVGNPYDESSRGTSGQNSSQNLNGGRRNQDGHYCAVEAMNKSNGARLGIMLTAGPSQSSSLLRRSQKQNYGIKCVLDGDGALCARAVTHALSKIYPPVPPQPQLEQDVAPHTTSTFQSSVPPKQPAPPSSMSRPTPTSTSRHHSHLSPLAGATPQHAPIKPGDSGRLMSAVSGVNTPTHEARSPAPYSNHLPAPSVGASVQAATQCPAPHVNGAVPTYILQHKPVSKPAVAAGTVPTMPSAMRHRLTAQGLQPRPEPHIAPSTTSAERPNIMSSNSNLVSTRSQVPIPMSCASLPVSRPPMVLKTSHYIKQGVGNPSPAKGKIAAGFLAAAQNAAIMAAKKAGIRLASDSGSYMRGSSRGSPIFRSQPSFEASDEVRSAARFGTQIPRNGHDNVDEDEDDSESEDEDARAERQKEVEREALIASRKGHASRFLPIKKGTQTGHPPTVSHQSSFLITSQSPKTSSTSDLMSLSVLWPNNFIGVDKSIKLEILKRLSMSLYSFLTVNRVELSKLDSRSRIPQGPAELKQYLADFEPHQVMTDGQMWYITFDASTTAATVFAFMKDVPFMGTPLPCSLHDPVTEAEYKFLLKHNLQVAPPRPSQPSVDGLPAETNSKSSRPLTDEELIKKATSLILDELRATFIRDLKNRIVAGRVRDLLKEEQQKQNTAQPSANSSSTPGLTPSITANTSKYLFSLDAQKTPALLKLPSFAKRKPLQPDKASRQTSVASVPELPTDSNEQQTEHPPNVAPNVSQASNLKIADDDATSVASSDIHQSYGGGSHAQEVFQDDDAASSKPLSEDEERPRSAASIPPGLLATKTLRKKTARKRFKKAVTFTSSEGEDEDESQPQPEWKRAKYTRSSESADPTLPPMNDIERVLQSKSRVEKNDLYDSRRAPVVEDIIVDSPQDDSATRTPTATTSPHHTSLTPLDAKLKPEADEDLNSRPRKKTKRTPARTIPAKDTKLTVFDEPPNAYDHEVAEDEEDLYYVKVVLENLRAGQSPYPPRPPAPSAGPSDLWDARNKVGSNDPALREQLKPSEPLNDEDENVETGVPAKEPLPPHSTGSSRTQGYYHITSSQKSFYLPQRNKAIIDVGAITNSGASLTAYSALAVSRSTRVNSRRFVIDMEQNKKASASVNTVDTVADVLKFNQLRTRKKQLKFARSPIHDWGLYAMEMIPAGEMVIEYVGEVIRQAVADRREKAYERMGIGSSYLFRVDDDLVVDATKKGNLGRLINHCCAPNCTAKIITINGEKKIVIYAKVTIELGDEVTYDYHFPKEDVKIPCLCGSSKCKGTLN